MGISEWGSISLIFLISCRDLNIKILDFTIEHQIN